MKKLFFTGFMLLLLSGKSFCQENRSVLNEIISNLKKLLTTRIEEKPYLQFDKPYYAAGDTIYFKAYVTAGDKHKLSTISGVLHVDLINTQSKIDQSVELHLDSGIAHGDFALPDSLPAGNYSIRAYTQWMRNFGDGSFFAQITPIGSIKPAKVFESATKQPLGSSKPDIQFLPESGTFVAGIPNKVAFKAIGFDGSGLDANGIIVDEEDRTVASFSSAHLGMGEFTFIPELGKDYTAKITYADGRKDQAALPKAQAAGIVLSIDNDAIPTATVTIKANATWYNENKGKEYAMLIFSGGLITTFKCKLDSPVIKFDLLKRKLRTGIATVTLFSQDNEPICERLFFIQNYDNLSLGMVTDKTLYPKRGKTDVKLHALSRKGDPAEGSFSVSVIDESVVPETDKYAGNILTHFLLTSDLKGFVERPGYYFADTTERFRKDLDLLMLTQGYRGFEWKQVLDGARANLVYQPEAGLSITGNITNLANKAIAGGTVNLIPAKGGGLLTTSSDAGGGFSFTNLIFTDTAKFMLNAVNIKGGNNTKIHFFDRRNSAPKVSRVEEKSLIGAKDTMLAGYISRDKVELEEVSNYLIKKPIMLKQVNVRDKKPDDQYRTLSLAGAGNADQVMHADEIERLQGNLVTSLNGRLRGITFLGLPPHQFPALTGMGSKAPMLIIVDGTEFSPDALNDFTANQIETVEVLKYANQSIYGVVGGHGVLVITLKQRMGLRPDQIASTGVLPITVMGFYKARQFYSPKYDTPAALSSKQRDLRSTIYWNPEIKTDKDGNASFEYYNADGTGTYKITIEGIDKDGNIGRQVYRYEVK